MSDTTNADVRWLISFLRREPDARIGDNARSWTQAALADYIAALSCAVPPAESRSAEPTSEEILRKFVTSLTGYLGSMAYECPAQFVSDTQQRAQEVLNRAALLDALLPESPEVTQ